MTIICSVVGFAMGALLTLVLLKFQRAQYSVLGTVTLGPVECINGDTRLRIPYYVDSGTPVDVRVQTYDSGVGMPSFGSGTSVTGNPIEVPYSPSSGHDRVIVYAAFASGPASGNIPCCSCSGSGSASTLVATSGSVLP